MRILMLGWEYPPHISGGLGTACQGLTEALARLRRALAESAVIRIRGVDKALPVVLSLARKGGRWIVDGTATTSFDSLSIPDPSIGVASVDGPIEIKFHLEDQAPAAH